LEFISQFTTDIRYVTGKDNVVADALSRIEGVNRAINIEALAEAQETDEELQEVMHDKQLGIRLKRIPIPSTNKQILCDTTTEKPRPYVTQPFRRQVFISLYGLAHPGIKATVKLITDRYIWKNIKSDCTRWARSCIQCQRAKISRHNKPPSKFEAPTKRFEHIHTDIVGPLPTSNGYRYCLTVIDRFSRWSEAIPVRNISAETIAQKLFREWMTRYRVPTRTYHQGMQFEAKLFRELMHLIGATHFRTTAYHPEANGLVERLHRQIKAAIRCHETEA